MKKIFDYTNFRLFLKDYYEERKSREGYTYRDFAVSVGMNSSSWLLHLIKGIKNLSSDTSIKVAKAIGLENTEAEFFKLLVLFNQAKTSDAKDRIYQSIIEFKRDHKVSKLSDEQYEYYTKWYHPVIRSLVSKVDFKEDYALLAKKCFPRITPVEAKKSVKLLVRLGLIAKNEAGVWKQVSPVLSTGDEVQSLNVINYHKQVSKLAEGAFDRSPRDARDISALTMGISEADFHRIKARIQTFRKEIMEIAQGSNNPDRVYQMNFQFFPVSGWNKENEQ